MASNREKDSRRGFTLIELMIVVAIIAIISAIAIPALIGSRIAANETSAVSTIRSLVIGNEQYRVKYGSYAPALADLWSENYLHSSVANPDKSGYIFVYSQAGDDYTFQGNPVNPGKSGHRYFFVDSSGVLRFSNAGPATAADLALDP